MTENDNICVGAFSGSYGVNGEVRLKSFCADPQAIANYSPLTSEDGKRSFTITLTRSIKGALVVKVDGITNKEDADTLKGLRLFTNRAQLPALPDDEYYHADLIGLTVLDTGGTKLGTVHAVQNHGASDLLEVTVEGSSATILLPFTNEVIPTVDLTAGRIIADPPEGTL